MYSFLFPFALFHLKTSRSLESLSWLGLWAVNDKKSLDAKTESIYICWDVTGNHRCPRSLKCKLQAYWYFQKQSQHWLPETSRPINPSLSYVWRVIFVSSRKRVHDWQKDTQQSNIVSFTSILLLKSTLKKKNLGKKWTNVQFVPGLAHYHRKVDSA